MLTIVDAFSALCIFFFFLKAFFRTVQVLLISFEIPRL